MIVRNLPHAGAPFVGRVSEIAEIIHRLNNADCRLLTLVGPGGIGKTRLAIRVAADCADQFDDGVFFVPFQPLNSPEFIVSTIADVVDFQFGQGGDLKQQLLQYMRERSTLLVLDNFEHLLDKAELLTEIIEAAPDLKLLVTSREALNLQEEWLYPVGGLLYPETDDADQPGAYSAIQLFVERARQVRSDLSLAHEQAAVIRVCQLVEGMPLALELAAVWAKALPTDEIAVEIQRNVDFLSTSMRNVPQRHQSMRAVFEQTWQRLTDEERRVFSALSVFRGGFRREAAQAVTGVSVRVLSDLGDKSLLTRDPDGRYQIYDLLRQYAQARLEAIPEEATNTHDLHSAYYARFLDEREGDLNSARQRKVSSEIEADIGNIRAAWSWSVDHAIVENINKLEEPLFQFYSIRGIFLEGIEAFERAVQMLDNGDRQTGLSLAKVLCDLGTLYLRAGELERARATLERSWLLYSQRSERPALGAGWDPRLPLGATYLGLGNVDLAVTLGQDAYREHTLREDQINLTRTCVMLAMTARVLGQYEDARHYAQQGYACTVVTGDEFMGSYCLYEWGRLSQLLGDMDDAKRRLQASYTLQKDFGDLKGIAGTLTTLGRIALLEGDHAEARRCYEQARTIYHDLGVDGELAICLEGMGNSARAIGHYGEARRYLREALQLSRQHLASLTPSIFVGIGELLLETGQQARGIELLAFALHHPASDQDTKERAQQLLNRYPATAAAASRTATTVDFDAVTTTILNELQLPEDRPLTQHTSQANETLVESLSERELAVLMLIIDGLSNREIAGKLFLSVATVKWYLTHIYSKLGVQTRTLAIARARQLHLVP